ncbi:MAG: hypothetical protein BACD_00160 [Bacteroides rodentium]
MALKCYSLALHRPAPVGTGVGAIFPFPVVLMVCREFFPAHGAAHLPDAFPVLLVRVPVMKCRPAFLGTEPPGSSAPASPEQLTAIRTQSCLRIKKLIPGAFNQLSRLITIRGACPLLRTVHSFLLSMGKSHLTIKTNIPFLLKSTQSASKHIKNCIRFVKIASGDIPPAHQPL